MTKKRNSLRPRICDCCMKTPEVIESHLEESMVICMNPKCPKPQRTTWMESKSAAIFDWNHGRVKNAKDSLGRRA